MKTVQAHQVRAGHCKMFQVHVHDVPQHDMPRYISYVSGVGAHLFLFYVEALVFKGQGRKYQNRTRLETGSEEPTQGPEKV